MKPLTFAATLLTSGFVIVTSQAQLLPWLTHESAPARPGQQHPMNANAPGVQLPPASAGGGRGEGTPSAPAGNSDVRLSDVLGGQRQINLFAGFTRDISSVSSRLDTSSVNTTVLAPVNSAIADLPRKPWEDPKDYSELGTAAYEGQAGSDRASRNLQRFVEAHIVPAAPWKEGEKVKSMGDSEVWWENHDGKAVVQPGNVEVDRVASRVGNGEVWVLKGVLNYAS